MTAADGGLQRGAVSVATAATEAPVSYQEAMEHLRLDSHDEASLVGGIILAATTWCEDYTRRAFCTQTLRYTLDSWPMICGSPYALRVPRPPLQSVSSITYIDSSGNSQTWAAANYSVDTFSTPGRIALGYSASLPVLRGGTMNQVTVNYVAGYGAAAAVPEAIKRAILLVVGELFEFREEGISGVSYARAQGAQRLLAPFRVAEIP